MYVFHDKHNERHLRCWWQQTYRICPFVYVILSMRTILRSMEKNRPAAIYHLKSCSLHTLVYTCAFYKIPQNSLPAVLLHMAGAFFIIPHTLIHYIFLPCFLNITSAITHGRCILHNSTICCGILWNCIFIVVLYGCSSKFHNCGTLWNEPVFCKTALIVGGIY